MGVEQGAWGGKRKNPAFGAGFLWEAVESVRASYTDPKTRETLWPPKPKLLDMPYLTFFSRATLGT
jgi:hypothetical protein